MMDTSTMNTSPVRSIVVFTALFLVSFFLRLPMITAPLHNGNYVSAHTLITTSIWHQQGIATYMFNPVYTYPDATNHGIINFGGLLDQRGNVYYVSYPPFSFYAAYGWFQLFGQEPNILLLRLFGLFLHGISTLILFHLIRLLYPTDRFAPWIASVLFLFIPLNAVLFPNAYFADALILPLFLLQLLLIVLITTQKHSLRRWIFLWGIVNFFAVYTEWLGLFFSLTVLSLCRWGRLKHFRFRGMVLHVTWYSSALAATIVLIQYSGIAGISAVFTVFFDKFMSRGTLGSAGNIPILGKTILMHYSSLLLLLCFMAMVSLRHRNQRLSFRVDKQEQFVLVLCCVPVLLHIILLFTFNTTHVWALWKTVLPVCLLTTMWVRKTTTRSLEWTAIGLIFFVCISTGYSYFSFREMNVDTSARIGLEIRNHSSAQDAVFLCNSTGFVSPQIIYTAQHNIRACKTTEDARGQMRQFGIDSAIVGTANNDYTAIHLERITARP